MSDFLDQLKLTVRAGRGGNGIVAFRREKFVPRGGPSGGKGGRGGHVILEAFSGINTLTHIQPNSTIRAGNGKNGGSSNKTGGMGDDALLKVPLGTIVRDLDSGEILGEFVDNGQRLIVAQGGNGGLGNSSFARSTQQTPKFASEGKLGEQLKIELELKLLADVGVIGLPNAGKSTLTATISAARPEIAAFPFTTLYPVLGVVTKGYESFVIADIPGLIEGAHKGVGLGHKFLKHIERTRILLHVVDIGNLETGSPAEQTATLDNELEQFKDELGRKPKLLVGNKIDLNPSRERISELEKFASRQGCDFCLISAATGEGTEKMINILFEMLSKIEKEYDLV